MTTSPAEDVVDRTLHLVEDGDVEAVRSLLTKNPGLVNVDPGLGSWLHCAVGDREMLAMLLEMGCDINSTYSVGSHYVTPVMTAMSEDDPKSLALLLEHGARLPVGRNLLHAIVGVKQHSLELVEILRQFGADLNEEFVDEESGEVSNALSYALAYDRDDVADYLKSIGCKLPGAQSRSEALSGADGLLMAMTEEFGATEPRSLIDVVATEPSIVVHAAGPNERNRCVTLFTTGMSANAMAVPKGEERFARAELFVQIPVSWPYRDLEDIRSAWPALWLRALAAYPHDHGTWLGGAVAIIGMDVLGIPIGGRFTAMLLLCEKEFEGTSELGVVGYRLFPIYAREVELEKKQGIGALLRLFDERNVSFVVDMERPPVA